MSVRSPLSRGMAAPRGSRIMGVPRGGVNALAIALAECEPWAMLIGHDSAIAMFEAALAGGRMHHAWMLSGPEGVGKRSFADAMARRLLGATDPDHPAAALIAAGTHPDLRVLEPPAEGAGSVQRIIAVDAVRSLRQMLHEHPAMGRWRVIIIDSADDMNPNAANALLKELEEPAKDTLLFLVSHASGRLLPTIRSRCRMLRFSRLADSEVLAVLSGRGIAADDAAELVAVADGRPGLALAIAQEPGLAEAIQAAAEGGDPMRFAREFQAPAAVNRFALMLRLLPARIAALARAHPSQAIIAVQGRAESLASEAIHLAFDRVQVAFALARLLAEAGRLSRKTHA